MHVIQHLDRTLDTYFRSFNRERELGRSALSLQINNVESDNEKKIRVNKSKF